METSDPYFGWVVMFNGKNRAQVQLNILNYPFVKLVNNIQLLDHVNGMEGNSHLIFPEV